jgi:hypothetical protein
MNSIDQLKDTGAGKRLLIVARGMSVLDFRFDLLPDDVETMIVNEQNLESTKYGADVIPNYMIYTDPDQADFVQKYGLLDDIILIGFKGNPCYRMDYWFNEEQIRMDGCTTVYYALQIAQLMGFREIYLIGVDLKTSGSGQVRYIGDHHLTDAEKKEYVEKNFNAMDACFYKIKWTTPIFNCNPESALRAFPHRVPWE